MLFYGSHAEVTEVEFMVESQGYVPVSIPAAEIAGDKESHNRLFEIGTILKDTGNLLFGPHKLSLLSIQENHSD